MPIAVDSWAFIEMLEERPRAPDVAAVVDDADFLFTTREIVAETFAYVVHRHKSEAEAWRWWESLRASRVRVFEPPLDEVHAFMARSRLTGRMTLADWSLAFVATRERATSVLTGDAEFRRVGLSPLFAP